MRKLFTPLIMLSTGCSGNGIKTNTLAGVALGVVCVRKSELKQL